MPVFRVNQALKTAKESHEERTTRARNRLSERTRLRLVAPAQGVQCRSTSRLHHFASKRNTANRVLSWPTSIPMFVANKWRNM